MLSLISRNSNKKSFKRSTFLGKVKIAGSTFVKSGKEVPAIYYPLEKRSVFSQIMGEIGLKAWYVDDETPPAEESTVEKSDVAPPPAEGEKKEEEKMEEKKEEEKRPTSEGSKKDEKPPEIPEPDMAVAPPPPPVVSEVENPPLVQQKNSQKAEKSIVAKNLKNIDIESKLFQKISNSDRRMAFDLVD